MTLFRWLLVLGMAALPFAAMAQHVPSNPVNLDSAYAGIWYNPAQPAHALQLTVLEGKQAVLSWNTYDAEGRPLWLLGEGSVNAFDITASLAAFSQGRPPAQWQQGDPEAMPWGTVRLEFTGCDTGTLAWDSLDPAFAQGQMAIVRYGQLAGPRCGSRDQFSQELSFSFERRLQGFQALLAGVAPGSSALSFTRESLPPPFHSLFGLRMAAASQPAGSVLLSKKAVYGLEPETYYRVEIDADILSRFAAYCLPAGTVGGLFIKLGAATLEPIVLPDSQANTLRLSVDIGVPGTDGANARVVGMTGSETACLDGSDASWEMRSFSTRGQPILMKTDAGGRLWVLAGADIAQAASLDLYLHALRVRTEPYEASL